MREAASRREGLRQRSTNETTEEKKPLNVDALFDVTNDDGDWESEEEAKGGEVKHF